MFTQTKTTWFFRDVQTGQLIDVSALDVLMIYRASVYSSCKDYSGVIGKQQIDERFSRSWRVEAYSLADHLVFAPVGDVSLFVSTKPGKVHSY